MYFKVPIDIFICSVYSEFLCIELGHHQYAKYRGKDYENKINIYFYEAYLKSAIKGFKKFKDYKYKPVGYLLNGVESWSISTGIGSIREEYNLTFENILNNLYSLISKNGYLLTTTLKVGLLNNEYTLFDIIDRPGVVGHFINDECIRKNSSDINSEVIWSKDILKLSDIEELQEKYSSVD